jgi:AcrR family transcriptional regulator
MICPLTNKRWERRKDARPQELMAAALDLFVERGYAATRLDDVASRAGVSKGTLYLYFTNKEELFKAVVRENLFPLLTEAEEIIDGYAGSSRDLFREFIFLWWERMGETKLAGITKLMMAESGNFPEVAQFYHDEVISRNNALIIRMLDRGIKRGEFRNINTEEAKKIICAPVIMLMLWKHSFNACQLESTSPKEYLGTFVDLMLNGLLSPPGSPAPAKGGAKSAV